MEESPLFQLANQLDREDPLQRFKEEFYIKKGVIYLDGNSLGLLSKRAEKSLLQVIEDWKEFAIDGWLNGRYPWFCLSEELGKRMEPLLGARPGEVIVTGSATANLHQLASTFYRPANNRTKILADSLSFPTDIYALQSQLILHGLDPDQHLSKIPSQDGRYIREEDIIAAMNEEVALLILPSVLYRSGQLLDIKRLTAEAHHRGILVGIDASHSVGSVTHAFHDWQVDFAFWCTYKYLNSGPGGVGGLFVHDRHQGRRPGLAGWFGSQKDHQFDMEHDFIPAPHAGGYQMGTPHVLSIAPLIGSLQMFEESGIAAVREKSVKLTGFLMDCIDHELDGMGFTVGTPREAERRGGHVALEHEEAVRICKACKEQGVVPDFRSPDIIRLAPVALYTSFKDVWTAIQILKEMMRNRRYMKFEKTRDIIA